MKYHIPTLMSVMFLITSAAAEIESVNVVSARMNRDIPATITLPSGYDESPSPRPVGYLLHGAGDDERACCDRAPVQQLADRGGMDMAYGKHALPRQMAFLRRHIESTSNGNPASGDTDSPQPSPSAPHIEPMPPKHIADQPIVPQKNFHIFLLMGQSNMAGYGPLEPGDEKPVAQVLTIPTIGEGDFAWKPAAHPLHNRLPDSDRFGLGIPFGIEYIDSHPGVKVGLIPVAWGGAGIDQLNKITPVYQDGIAKARWAARQGLLKGVLWHQGESDTVTNELATTYAKKLDQLVADLRGDLGEPALPFVAGNLAEFYGTGPDHNGPSRVAQINEVRKALRELPHRVAQTAFVESTDLKSIDGHMVHFDRDSYIELGKRFAKAIAPLLVKAAQGNPIEHQ